MIRRHDRLNEILSSTLDLPQSERAAFLAKACGDDTALLRELESLIALEDEAAGFLEEPAVVIEDSTLSIADRRVGPYRLVREIGRGGMGVVWMAERADAEFEQRVAIKLLDRLARDEDRHRFEQERQILANLQHPGIARLYGGGTTEVGVPYLVMELVDGIPIDEYATNEALSVRQTVELLVRVCKAVEAAHDLQVVHRDLKPSNILVDANGRPHLLDFGISKAIGAETEAELTRTGQRILTPRYASPEQITGTAITPATDVHAIGVLLYELLTGEWPFGDGTGSDVELEDQVRYAEARRPSSTAKTRRRELRGDVDTILLEALRKEPDRRYPNATSLRVDLERFLAGLPIAARPDSGWYRCRKFVARHRAWTIAAAMSLIALVAVGYVVALLNPEIEVQKLTYRQQAAHGARLTWMSPDIPEGAVFRLYLDGELIRVLNHRRRECRVVGLSYELHEFRLDLVDAELGGELVARWQCSMDMRQLPPVIEDDEWTLARVVSVPFGLSLVSPHFAADGTIYTGNLRTNPLYPRGLLRIGPEARSIEPIGELGRAVEAIAVDPSSGRVFAVRGEKLWMWEPGETSARLWVTSLPSSGKRWINSPSGIAFPPRESAWDSLHGQGLIADRGYSGNKVLSRGDPDEVWRFSAEETGVGRIVHRDSGDDDPLVAVHDITITPSRVFLADFGGSSVAGAIFELFEDGALREIETSEPLSPTGICSDPVSGDLFVSETRDFNNGRIVRVDPRTGQVRPVLKVLNQMRTPLWAGVDISPNGKQLVTYDCAGVYVFERNDDGASGAGR